MTNDNTVPKPGQHVNLRDSKKQARKARGTSGGKATQAKPKTEPVTEPTPEPVIEATVEQEPTVEPTHEIVYDPNAEVFAAIVTELGKQDEKWGEQNHAMCGGKIPERGRISHDDQATTWKVINDRRVAEGNLGWDGILIEECYEAAGAPSRDEQIEELVQVAAVAVAAIKALKRQAAA